MKLAQLRELYHKELQSIYNEGEINTLFFWVAEKITDKPVSILKLALEEEWYEFEAKKNLLLFHLMELKSGRPIQYILGETEFYGMKFFVNENVLIPRPETEELIEWIIKDNSKNEYLRIFDIGTGSGCIPITLKKKLPNTEVYSTDISEEALDLAKVNAEYHHTDIHFIQADFLNFKFSQLNKFDIIVSNPPYIAENERAGMDGGVTKYEPSQALFVPDNDPLIFYKRIIEFAQSKLKKSGRIYVEINQNLAEETKSLFEKHFRQVELKKDISGNYRMIKTQKL